jgi:hypothetical protein
MEWAYTESSEGEVDWKVVDSKAVLEDANIPDGIEKLVGFEGQPDPATGFYCQYDGGRLAEPGKSSAKR